MYLKSFVQMSVTSHIAKTSDILHLKDIYAEIK